MNEEKQTTLPEIFLTPEDMKQITEMVSHCSPKAAFKLRETFEQAKPLINSKSKKIKFLCPSLTIQEAELIQEILMDAEITSISSEDVCYFGHLVEEWRHVSGDLL